MSSSIVGTRISNAAENGKTLPQSENIKQHNYKNFESCPSQFYDINGLSGSVVPEQKKIDIKAPTTITQYRDGRGKYPINISQQSRYNNIVKGKGWNGAVNSAVCPQPFQQNLAQAIMPTNEQVLNQAREAENIAATTETIQTSITNDGINNASIEGYTRGSYGHQTELWSQIPITEFEPYGRHQRKMTQSRKLMKGVPQNEQYFPPKQSVMSDPNDLATYVAGTSIITVLLAMIIITGFKIAKEVREEENDMKKKKKKYNDGYYE